MSGFWILDIEIYIIETIELTVHVYISTNNNALPCVDFMEKMATITKEFLFVLYIELTVIGHFKTSCGFGRVSHLFPVYVG